MIRAKNIEVLKKYFIKIGSGLSQKDERSENSRSKLNKAYKFSFHTSLGVL